MPSYDYIAKDGAGVEQAGVMQADSESVVARSLSQRSLFPVRIAQRSAQKVRAAGRVRLRDLASAYVRMADLLRAGIPMLRTLDILIKTTSQPRLNAVISSVRDDVAAGVTLADAMARHAQVFSDLHVSMVRAGESAGFLEDVLTNLSQYLERQDDLQSKVRGALVYPLMLVGLGGVAVLAILLLLVPKFKGMFSGISLPLPSRILFGLSDLLREQSLAVIVVGAMAVSALVVYFRRPAGQTLWSRWQLKIPLAGTALRMVAVTRFCRILGTLIRNGVPILQALNIAKDAAGNLLLRQAIEKAAENVRAGEPLAEPLKASGLFPTEIVEMIAVGEESNQLEKVLLETADAVERRTNRQVDIAIRLVEPLLLLLVALMIGFVAMGLLYPVFTMARTMR